MGLKLKKIYFVTTLLIAVLFISACQHPSGNIPSGNTQTENTPAESNPSENNPSESTPAESTPSGKNSSETDLPQDNTPKNTEYPLLEFSAAQSATSTNEVTLTWKDTVDVYKYYVYYNTEDNKETAKKYSSNGYAYKQADNTYKGNKNVSLPESGTYYFWIKAVDKENNESNFSKNTSCSFVYSSLQAPTNISASQSTTSWNTVNVSWEDKLEAYKYSFYYSTENDSSKAKKFSTAGYAYKSGNVYKGSRKIYLSESGTYYFWVKAVDGTNKESEFSEAATCSFTFSTLQKPFDVMPSYRNNQLSITWKDIKEAYKYTIYYNTENNIETAKKYNSNGYAYKQADNTWKGNKEIELNKSELSGSTYYFWIKGVDGTNHESEYSDVASITITN